MPSGPETGDLSDTPATKPLSEQLRGQIAAVREMMLTVHYFPEASWLLAAVDFPSACDCPLGQEALRHAATIAWQFGFPEVTHWLLTGVLHPRAVPVEDSHPAPLPSDPAADVA